ncbi:hypothetical protein J6590_088302 [Homalodisca vitripennis]|nr:hypothetical protein J6590_088302 [Homalodisca vitripennis]
MFFHIRDPSLTQIRGVGRGRQFDGIRDRRGIRGRSCYGWTDATPRQCDMALRVTVTPRPTLNPPATH